MGFLSALAGRRDSFDDQWFTTLFLVVFCSPSRTGYAEFKGGVALFRCSLPSHPCRCIANARSATEGRKKPLRKTPVVPYPLCGYVPLRGGVLLSDSYEHHTQCFGL